MPGIFAAASAAGRQFCPATRMWMSPPIALAAVTAWSVAAFRVALSCSARRRVVMSRIASDHAGFVAQLVDQLGDRGDLAAALALRRLVDLERHEARRHVDA